MVMLIVARSVGIPSISALPTGFALRSPRRRSAAP